MRDHSELEKKIGYKFKDESVLINALTHSSYTAENGKSYHTNNERLEFIGDGYLDALIGLKLYNILLSEKEGRLSKDRANIVCERSLAGIARELELGEYLYLGKGEESSGGSDKDSILADALEALIGAIVIDGGYDAARDFVWDTFAENTRLAIKNELYQDYKTRLQEELQEKYKQVKISYKLISQTGPDHDKEFTVSVNVKGEVLGTGKGKSKKEAEQNAAKDVLTKGDI